MKKTILMLALLSVSGSGVVMAQDFEQYVSAKGALSYVQNKYTGTTALSGKAVNNFDHKKSHSVAGLRLAYGLDWQWGWTDLRTEVEYGYNGKAKLNLRDNHVNARNTVNSHTMMVNAYYDIDLESAWKPYVGVGVGVAQVKSDNRVGNVYFSDKSNNFAWNISAGVTYQVNEKLAIDAGYRYTDYGKAKSDGNMGNRHVKTESKIRGNELNIGVRYTFKETNDY